MGKGRGQKGAKGGRGGKGGRGAWHHGPEAGRTARAKGKYGRKSQPAYFHGQCSSCGQWGHEKAFFPSPSKMDVGAVAAPGSASTAASGYGSPSRSSSMSDPGSGVSARIQAVSAYQPAAGGWWEDEDWPAEIR